MNLAGQVNRRTADAGYAMAALIVAMGIMAIMMTVAMPVWRQTAQREKEEELVFRGLQYAQRALAAGQTMQLTVELHALHVNLYLAANQPDLAGPHVEAALQAAERLQSPYLLGIAALAAARAAAARGEVDDTTTSFDAALRWFEAAQTPVERALALEERTRAMASLMNPPYVGSRAH